MKSALVLAAPHSGAGKTTITLSLLSALTARGLSVQPFKVGPDYIDPSHHTAVTGRVSENLDTWMLPPDANRRIFARAGREADVAVVEGVMGLYDGVDGRSLTGSTADLARLLDLPVILVVDARSMARSAAALVHGFRTFDPAVRLAAVIWNQVGSGSHRRILDEALESSGLPASLGAVPREAEVVLPERHLGLVTPEDVGPSSARSTSLASLAEDHIDIDRLLEVCALPSGRRYTLSEEETRSSSANGARRRLGVARDRAFCFYYEENLRLLRSRGAELVFFRPTEGDGVPPNLDALYLGGGYPELHAPALSRNAAFIDGLRDLQGRGRPIYAECGGFMTLCEGMEDIQGTFHRMAGLFPTRARMNRRRFRLGYRRILASSGPTGQRTGDTELRGHEFHYSSVETMPEGVARSYRVFNARGEEQEPEGYRMGSTLAGYIHLHFGSCPEFFSRLFDLPSGAGT